MINEWRFRREAAKLCGLWALCGFVSRVACVWSPWRLSEANPIFRSYPWVWSWSTGHSSAHWCSVMIFDKSIEYLRTLWMENLHLNSFEFRRTVLILIWCEHYQEQVLCMFPREKKLLFTLNSVFCPWTVSNGHGKMCFRAIETCNENSCLKSLAYTNSLFFRNIQLHLAGFSLPASRLRAVIRRERTELLVWSAPISDDHKQISKFGADLNPLQ